MTRCTAVVTLALWLGAASISAQARNTTVMGRIVDNDDRPVAGAVVHVETHDRVTLTADDGGFVVDSVMIGNHTIMISAVGYAPRRYRFVIPEGRTRATLGDIALTPSSTPSFRVSGTVRDLRSGAPLPNVPVRLNGRVVTVTNQDGAYVAVGEPTDESLNVIETRRIGYRPAVDQFATPEATTSVQVDLAMEPAPVELDALTVEAPEVELSTGRLEDFYRRRDMGFGHFFTRVDIQRMNPVRPSDVLRRVPGVVIITEENVNADPFGAQPMFSQLPKTTIQFSRAGSYARGGSDRPCSPLIFVNDVMVGHEDFDTITRTRDIAGMEVYPSAAQVPAEYNRLGAACGVIALWTDGRTGEGRIGAGFQIGGQFVGEFARGGFVRQQIGVQMMAPMFGRFEFRPSFTLIVGGQSSLNAGWQALVIGAVHPLDVFWPLYVGAGMAATRVRPAFSGQLTPPQSDITPAAIAGLALNVRAFRPYAELQGIDPVSGDGTLQFAFGVTIRTSAPAESRF